MLRRWVLESAMEVHWPLSVSRESLLPPPLRMVLAPALTSTSMAKVSEPMFWPGRVAATLRTTEGIGELAPSVSARMSRSVRMLTLVPFEPLVSPPLYLRQLTALCFPSHS